MGLGDRYQSERRLEFLKGGDASDDEEYEWGVDPKYFIDLRRGGYARSIKLFSIQGRDDRIDQVDSKEVDSRKITVNALALGLVETEMAAEMNAEYREKILAMIPLGRLGNVREVAEIACFMLSPAAAYITGQVIQADGGLAM